MLNSFSQQQSESMMSKTHSNNKFYYETKIKDLTDEVSFYRTMIKKLRQDKKDLELQLDMHEWCDLGMADQVTEDVFDDY